MTILGLDPGVATIGFGLISSEGSHQKPLRFGVITTPAHQALSLRLSQIYDDATELIKTFKPDAIAMEELFFNTNHTTGIMVAQGRGVLILAGAKCGVPMYEYTPLQVKQAVAGYGRAEKKQVMEMVRRLMGLKEVVRPDDASDALAIAICHARFSSSLLAGNTGSNVCSTI